MQTLTSSRLDKQSVPRKRVFWLGMHQVLTQTELPRLRELGYEVFNPPYLSDVEDQSAMREWHPPTDSTLPADVAARLAATEFFYKPLPEDIGEILNHFFDAVIVTINPGWLHEVLRVYRGRLIYRVYGQPYSLSNGLLDQATARLISERDDFWFAPHSDMTLSIEDPWLLTNTRIIPYCLTPDVVARRDTWRLADTAPPEMGMLCPRALDNHYYGRQYVILKKHFPSANYRIFGAQIVPVDDPQVVGTLQRGEFLGRMRRLRGYVYHYAEPTVCYLPPIEFMTLGGPVAYIDGSLLSRYFAARTAAPGCARTMSDLQRLARRLEQGDRGLADEIIASQAPVRMLYQPEHVWPIFDRQMRDMIEGTPAPASRFLLTSLAAPGSPATRPAGPGSEGAADVPEIVLAFHAFGPAIQKRGLEYHCAEGIARVMRQAVRALTDAGYRVIVTSRKEHVGSTHGFFAPVVADKSRLKVLAVSGDWSSSSRAVKEAQIAEARRVARRGRWQALKFHVRTWLSLLAANPLRTLLQSRRLSPIVSALRFVAEKSLPGFALERLRAFVAERFIAADGRYLSGIEGRRSIMAVLVSHYHLFPEIADLEHTPVVLYLPDYLPHFYKGQSAMGASLVNARVGKRLTDRAARIFTNSRFTQSYLPQTELAVQPGKIVYFPLPDLGQHPAVTPAEEEETVAGLPDVFVFYPTRERASKRLFDFATTVAKVNSRLAARGAATRVHGVLTTRPSARIFADRPDAEQYVAALPELSDSQLQVVYRKALALLFTSELEGNFPTQITEALSLRVPVVATDIPLITDELGAWSQQLTLISVGNTDAYAAAILDVLDNRQAAIERQEGVREHLRELFSYERFASGLTEIFQELAAVGSAGLPPAPKPAGRLSSAR